MSEQKAFFDIHMEVGPGGILTSAARGNLNPAFILTQLELLKRKLLDQMETAQGKGQLTATKSVPNLSIRQMP
jgi:hypothetical protein